MPQHKYTQHHLDAEHAMAEWSCELDTIEQAMQAALGDPESLQGMMDRAKEYARRAAEKLKNVKNKVVKAIKPASAPSTVTVQLPAKYYEEMERMLLIFTQLLQVIMAMAGKSDAAPAQEEVPGSTEPPPAGPDTGRALYYVLRSQ